MITQGQGSPRDFGGRSGKQLAEGFVTVQTAGAREVAEELRRLANSVGADADKLLYESCRDAARIIQKRYKAKVGDVTGNLAKSVRIEKRVYPQDNTVLAIVGPYQSGRGASQEGAESGNHAWIVEFGTDRRKPGTKGRRTYLNVHQMINGKMKRAGSFNNDQFANMSKGYYYLMGAINEPTRQARWGRGGDHDFWTPGGSGKSRPVTLHPGETYGAMPAKHAMEQAISESGSEALNSLINSIQSKINGIIGQ
jgi:hypothetical protein